VIDLGLTEVWLRKGVLAVGNRSYRRKSEPGKGHAVKKTKEIAVKGGILRRDILLFWRGERR